MLDLLSPVRGYIAQSLQFYLSKYIEDIQLEGLGLFGGDLVLNDLELKRHVLRESLDIPSSFDFSRGFLRELRIHIPWTQLLSQPIEVKLYTVELILTAKSEQQDAAPRPAVEAEDRIDQPKSGWIHDTLQKILANVSVQINNLVLKYEHDDVVFSIALGTLDFYSASESDGWKRSFEDLRGGRRAICKRIDAKDVTIFLDRYTSDGDSKDGQTQDQVRREVVGYEVPVLSRTSASVRVKLQLFPNAAVKEGQDERRSRPSSPLHQPLRTTKDVCDEDNNIDVDGLFAYRSSVMSDPFYSYSCNRSSVTPLYEVDVFIGELLFSVSDRQLEMLNQLIKSTSRKIDQAHDGLPPLGKHDDYVPGALRHDVKAKPAHEPNIPAVDSLKDRAQHQQIDSSAKKQESWFGWAMNALGTAEDEGEDELVSELLAETRGALLNVQPPVSEADEDVLAASGPGTKTSCVRLCISSASLTLRKHEKREQEMEHQDSTIDESGEELVPVANLGMVKVSLQTRKRRVARPAVPILHLSLSYVALEMLLARGEEQSGTDLVFEIEEVKLVSATASENREDPKCKKGQVLLTWGSIDSAHFSNCVSHPYFINSFFGEETTRLNQRETRSFEIVKVSLDTDIPVWKTLEVGRRRRDLDENADSQCECFTAWNGEAIRCIPIATVSEICQHAIRAIGIKERVLDGGILSNAVSTAWASSGVPISISEVMARAFTSIAEEYRALRNPDVGALDNLALLLQPQLVALLSRYSLHSCSAASLHGLSQSSNVRHRSVHSALRLRLASTSHVTGCDESSPDDTKKETISKVLDISLGTAKAMLDPPKCVEIIEMISIILHRNEEDDNESELGDGKPEVPVTENVPPSLQTVVDSDVKLITVSNLRVCLPDSPVESGHGEVNSCGELNVSARDFAWLRTFHPGSNKSRLQLGAASAHLERVHHANTIPLVEALGFELLVTENSADGGDNDGLFTNLDKLRVDVSLSAVQDAAIVANAFLSPLGYPIPWKPLQLLSKTSRTSFQIEACGAAFSRIVSNRPRLVMAQRQSLCAEVASVSVSLNRSGSTYEANRSILQSGVAPVTIRGSEARVPVFKLDILQEKTSGVLNAVPLLGSLKLFSLNPGSLESRCAHCQLAINVQVDRAYVELEGVFHLVAECISIVKGITASFPARKEPILPCADMKQSAMIDTSVNSAPTGWRFTINLKFTGGEVRVNEALQLNISSVSMSTVESEAARSKEVTAGGALKIVCAMKDATLNVSGNGVLKELMEPMVLIAQDCSATMEVLQTFADDRQAYAVDVTLHVSSIQASLSRLKLLYLLKIPSTKTEARSIKPQAIKTSQPKGAVKREAGGRPDSRSRWNWRLGAQLDLVGFSYTADVNQQLNHRNRQIRAAVEGKVLNIGVATRIANHHPIINDLEGTVRRTFTDIQVSVGDVQVVERLQSTKREIRTTFGEFSRIPEHAFLGILVCLDLPDLKCLSETMSVSTTSIPDQQSLPSAMLSWHLTGSIAKAFQEASGEWHRSEAGTKQPIAEIPLVVSWNHPALTKNAHSFPLLSGFYRNYSEAGLPHHIVAGSVESVDVAVTTSSLYCLASVLNVRDRVVKSKPGLDLHDSTEASTTSDLEIRAQDLPDDAPRVSLADVEVSLLLGQVRLILPSESLMDSILSKQSVVTGNVIVVLESLSVASAVRNDISLDGLGYPPFNSRILPRRPTVQAQRFGQSQLRIGCRAGKISGFVAELEFDQVAPTPKSMLQAKGPFEEHIGHVTGYTTRFSNSETFWSPLNVTCSIEEEDFATNDAGAKTSVSIALTKVRLDLHKPSFDVLVTRVVGAMQGVGALRRSVVTPPRARLKPLQLSKPHKPTAAFGPTNQREVAFSCDGVEVNAFDTFASTHIRVGAIVLAHNLSDLSGNASVQNLVVGHRTAEGPKSLTHKTFASEEVVFGANAEPSLWQLAVENYPEKLIATRWNFGDRTEGTLFLDVQAYQFHVSRHFVLALTRFIHSEPELPFSGSCLDKINEHTVEPMVRRPFAFQSRWNIKVLVAPSVMSYWRQTPTKSGRSGVWMTSGQLFASVGVGSDEMAQQSVLIHGHTINEISRFVALPTLEMMLNVDRFGINTSDDLPPLEVHFQRSTAGPISTHTSSTWQQFSKYISAVSEAQRLLHDCSVRITGDQQQILERVPIGETGVCLLYTPVSRTSIQAEVNALCVKLSSFSLSAIQSLLATRADSSDKQVDSPSGGNRENDARDTATQKSFALETLEGTSTDDFKSLRRMAGGRRPSPGELVFTEALLIETQSIVSGGSFPVACAKVQIQIDRNSYAIELADVAAYLKDCNEPWGIEDQDPKVERSSITRLGNKTHSWMGMRWSYHIPRKLNTIVANPVPIPPTGVPSGWPSWSWNQDQEEARRLCDIMCQLRCWNSRKACYVLVCEFFVPWERALTSAGFDDLDDAYEPGSFGELMSQWFDDDMKETRYRAKLLEFGARTRTFSFDNDLPSDNWELRWRSPLQSEQESENKQKRLVVNALLASSLQVHSVLASESYQRVVSSISLPRVTLSVSRVGYANDSHDIITAELNDTVFSCAVSGSSRTRTLNVRLSSAIQVYLDNMVQLLTVSVIPRTTVDTMIEASAKGLDISTLIGPVSVYLNQTSMLVLSSIPKLLQADPKSSRLSKTKHDEKLSSMRIRIVNYSGVDIWYRQEGTSECLLLAADTSAAYSWLSLANSPFYQLRFAIDDPRQKQAEIPINGKSRVYSEQAANEDTRWCDPCRIKENVVTGRYFSGHGFLWVCVELSGLQTIVTLRSSLTVRNYCDFPVRNKVNKEASERGCVKSDELYRDTHIIQRSARHHPSCISLDGSACTLDASAEPDGSVSRIMVESVSNIDFGIGGGSWCNVAPPKSIPSEFDLVKISDDQADGLRKTQSSFAILHPESPDECTHYAWAKIGRVQCNTVLPTDFNPLQPQVSRRYTWMELSIWPAVTVENTMDIPVALRFSQKATTINLLVAPSSQKCISAINPFEPVHVQLQYEQRSGAAQNSLKPLEFLLECSAPVPDKEQIFDFEGCRVVASFCEDCRPMIRIRTERILSIANMTPSVLNVNIGNPLGNQEALEKIDPCDERSVGFSVVSNRLKISIATIEDSIDEASPMEWSPEISLNVNGDTKPIVVPPARAELRSLTNAYCIELVNSNGYLKLIIRPQIVVINSTNCELKFIPTDGRGNALVEEDESLVIASENAGWCVPVCLHKEAKKRSITADVSSWLSSKLSRRPIENLSSAPKQPLVARLSCSFRVSLVEDGYEWTEEIAVLLPKLPLTLNPDGKLQITEPLTSSVASPNAQEGLYPAPSTTTNRRRLLIRHRGFRHTMLTYTMTQKGTSIHIMFFVDHQPPVIIHNQWQSMLGFRNVSFPSDPEGVGADCYLEYDWGLQVYAKHRESRHDIAESSETGGSESESKLFCDWLEASSQSLDSADISSAVGNERMRFQIGLPQYGWSNALWQVGGIQFASFTNEKETATVNPRPTFLVMCFYRAGSWLISITCLEDPTRDGQASPTPALVLPSTASSTKAGQTAPAFLRVGMVVEELSLHFCDEHDPLRDARGMILYPEILRATCSAVSVVFATAPDPPEVSRYSKRLGYLSHIRSYTTLFVAVEDVEVGHFLQTCNFPVILCFPETHASKDLLQFDRVKKHERLGSLMGKLLDKKLPGSENASLLARVIYTDTWDPVGIPSYFHSIELKLSPAVLQVEDDILSYLNAFIRPVLDALEGEAASNAVGNGVGNGGRENVVASCENAWSTLAYESAVVTKQRKVFVERLGISSLQVTITARVSIPVLNSFDGTPLHFGSTKMREVFAFPDQLYKDLAADYVADTIVRSPMLLMSLNIIGNPAGFVRSFGQGVRDLVEIPLAASRNGYSPWVLTKGVAGGVASFLGHATTATLTSVSGFSYSISRTMDQLTLPPDQLRKRHYTRPTQLSSALADGLGSLGSSVVGAAAGVITTPIAVYKERQMRGLDTGIRNVVGGVGMGLVGIVARPMGGVASLVSMASDGLLYGMGGNRVPFDDSISRFDAKPNELLRYKLKVLPDAIGSSLIFAHGIWVVLDESKLITSEQELGFIPQEELEASENDTIRGLLRPADMTRRLVQVTVVCSNECVYVVGVSGAQNQNVLVRASLESIEAVEESLTEPTIFDLGIKTPASAEWLRFRLPPRQRRHLSHQLRLWLTEDAV